MRIKQTDLVCIFKLFYGFSGYSFIDLVLALRIKISENITWVISECFFFF